MSKIKLKNNIDTEFSIEHIDDTQAISVSSVDMSKVKPIDTISDLKALPHTPSTVWVSGYTNKGDGAFGSHIFEWDSASTEDDNKGTIIKLDSITTGRYKLRYDGSVNVKWFGASETRIDNEVPINKALSKYKTIYIPAGTFKISAPIYLYSYSIIFGENKKTTVIKKITNTLGTGTSTHPTYGTISYEVDSAFILVAPDDDFATEVSMKGISIEGIDSSNSIAYGLYFPLISNLVLLDMDIRYSSKAYYSLNGWQCSISNILMYKCDYGLYFDGGSSVNIKRCWATSITTIGYYMHLAYSSLNNCAGDGNGGTTYVIYNSTSIVMNSCGNEDSAQALHISGSQSVVVDTFYQSNTTQTIDDFGIVVDSASKGVIFNGVVLLDTQINVTSSSNVLCNECQLPNKTGIELTGRSSIVETIYGNRYWNTFSESEDRIIYVSPDGQSSNTGTKPVLSNQSDTYVRTIENALALIPSTGVIHLVGGTTHTLNNLVEIKNKRIVITSGNDGKPSSVIKAQTGGGLKLLNSSITIESIDIETESNGGSLDTNKGFFYDCISGSATLSNSSVVIKDIDLFNQRRLNNSISIALRTTSIDISTDTNVGSMLRLDGNAGVSNLTWGGGNSISSGTIKDSIVGITYDDNTTPVPRNITSNIIL